MSLRIYAAHNLQDHELPVLWELQASGAGKGIEVFIPRYHPISTLTASRRSDIQRSDALLAIATSDAPHLREEIHYAHGLGKPVIALATFQPHAFPLGPFPNVEWIAVRPEETTEELMGRIGTVLHSLAQNPAAEGAGVQNAIGAIAAMGALFLFLNQMAGKPAPRAKPRVKPGRKKRAGARRRR